jgi:hypothetical protein
LQHKEHQIMAPIVRWSRWPLALLTTLIALTVTFGSAFAGKDPPRTPPPPPANGAKAPPRTPPPPPANAAHVVLKREYQASLRRLREIDVRLNHANGEARRLAERVAKAKAAGKDVGAIEAALGAFQDGVAKARAAWQAAGDKLRAHNGFDEQGNVTNADAARTTLKSANEQMRTASETLANAQKALGKAIAAWERANREKPRKP